MPLSPAYNPATSFANDETNQVAGRSTVRTVQLDTEHANIASSINALKTNLELLQRDDGKLDDFLVEPYALAEQTRALVAARGTPRGLWAAGTVYAVGDVVQQASVAYQCYTAHTASAPFTANGFWIAISGDGSAAASAAAAAASETNAATSAMNAASSATTATTKAGEAATSATNAANSATSSANSATASANSASAAATSATQAADSFDSFDDRYLGAKASAPTLDNDGNALVTGALYFDTASNVMKVYTGSAWSTVSIASSGFIATLLDDTTDAAARTTLGLGTENLGALAAGTTADVTVEKSFSGYSGGSTDFRAWVDRVTASGANAIAGVNAHDLQLELTATGGVTSAFGEQAYIRAGLGGVGAVNVTSMRVYDAHCTNEGTGTVGVATCFFADGVDLLDGTGPIQTAMGFYAGNQGHATRVTDAAIGFNAGDQTAGAPLTAGFRSQVSDGTNKFNYYAEGSAPNLFIGKVGIGSSTRPTDALELYQGYAKLCGSTTKLATGQYHEIRTEAADFICYASNGHATTPNGLRVRFSASPNNTTQRFLFCDDPGGDRLVIWSNGNIVNQNNSYGAISDAKLKRDVRDAGSQWADIKAIRFRKYKLISDGEAAKEQLGVIAQELETISPGLVSESPGVDDSPTKSVNYSVLYLKAVKALQEAMARIEVLEAAVLPQSRSAR